MTSMTCLPTYRRENLVRPCLRHCVRGVRLSRRFPLAGPLPSAPSAGVGLGARLAPESLSPSPLFGGFAGTMGPSDFLRSYTIGVRPWTSRCGLPHCWGRANAGSPGSRARCFRTCTGSLTARGLDAPCDVGASSVAFRPVLRRRHPGVGFLSRLNTRPARTPVNASTTPSRASPHDSGPLWPATPSTCDSFIHCTLPVYPGAQHQNSNKLQMTSTKYQTKPVLWIHTRIWRVDHSGRIREYGLETPRWALVWNLAFVVWSLFEFWCLWFGACLAAYRPADGMTR